LYGIGAAMVTTLALFFNIYIIINYYGQRVRIFNVENGIPPGFYANPAAKH
jgi:hypothetical protein